MTVLARRLVPRSLVAAAFVVGCGPSHPAAEAAPSPTQAPVAAPAPPVSSAPADSATAPPGYDELPPVCVGAALDLDAVIASGKCEHGFPAEAPPSVEAMIVHLDRTPEVEEGGAQEVTLNVRNRSGEALVIDLQLDCEATAFAVRTFAGKAAPPPPRCDERCTTRTVRFGLPDQGLARKVVRISAVQTTCGRSTGAELAPGVYGLRVRAGMADPDREAWSTLHVRGADGRLGPNDPNTGKQCSVTDSNGPLPGGHSTTTGCAPDEYCQCGAQAGYSCSGTCLKTRPGE